MPNNITLPRPGRRRARRREVVGDPIIWTPGAVADYVRQTSAMFDAVDTDYQAASKAGALPAVELRNWTKFRDTWRAYAKDASNWTGGTVDVAEDYRRQLAQWRLRVAKYVKPSSPAPHIAPSNPLWSFGGGAGFGALVAVGLVVYLLSKSGPTLPRGG